MKHEAVLVAVLHDVHILAVIRDSLLAPACNVQWAGLWNLGWDNCNTITKERTSVIWTHMLSPNMFHFDFQVEFGVTKLKLQMLTSALPRNSSAQPWRHPKSPHSSNWIGALNRLFKWIQITQPQKSPGFALDNRHMPSSVSKTLDSPPCCCIFFLGVWIVEI